MDSVAEPDGSETTSSRARGWLLEGCIALGSFALLWVVGWILSGDKALPEIIQGIVGLLGVGLSATGMVWFFRRRMTADADRFADGRERVRDAEQGLERALQPHLVTDGLVVQGSVHGDVSIHYPGTDGSGAPLPPEPADRAEEEVANGVANVPTAERKGRLPLSELWAVTHRRLDLYHEIALSQASRSFRNAQIAMGLGFSLLVAFVFMALRAGTTAGSVVAGGLGAVAATLAGYVSRTFIRSQEAAAGHLRAYFDQPLEFSRYLAAERLIAEAELSEEQRGEMLATLIEAMVVAGCQKPVAKDAASKSPAT
ncbi:TRADD-N-associated membrane domain-containing protein [Streptomyces pinistramenti]|uniref:TRADD-N-associated membrane domain-containing protein n=1 Tax=Streptomyces pinistramenti TaxID=2884812 RepID=UPI001D06C611|nr:hypothetical protein [Streptomyces pinistramenti]MCB5910149.1 hypothetical protein [Streptomyces pinistramenti]